MCVHATGVSVAGSRPNDLISLPFAAVTVCLEYNVIAFSLSVQLKRQKARDATRTFFNI